MFVIGGFDAAIGIMDGGDTDEEVEEGLEEVVTESDEDFKLFEVMFVDKLF